MDIVEYTKKSKKLLMIVSTLAMVSTLICAIIPGAFFSQFTQIQRQSTEELGVLEFDSFGLVYCWSNVDFWRRCDFCFEELRRTLSALSLLVSHWMVVEGFRFRSAYLLQHLDLQDRTVRGSSSRVSSSLWSCSGYSDDFGRSTLQFSNDDSFSILRCICDVILGSTLFWLGVLGRGFGSRENVVEEARRRIETVNSTDSEK
ncbi:hypothetical protein M3Y94_00710600 [Aphelenchoides besseyi]|nr:hypothetical protein M3Y94_00710600 [Aphelenchoides besseyi]